MGAHLSQISKATKRRPCFVSETKSREVSLGDSRKWCLGNEITRACGVLPWLFLDSTGTIPHIYIYVHNSLHIYIELYPLCHDFC